MTIFISIASYCDSVLPYTVTQAIAKAANPKNLHFGIVDQSPNDTPHPFPQGIPHAKLSYHRVDPLYARGPCWARAQAMTMYTDENWFFQIDSHTDFDQNWDDVLIQNMLAFGQKAVISSYPNPFTLENGSPSYQICTRNALVHVVKRNAQFTEDRAVLSFEAHPITTPGVIRGFHVGAGCLFTQGSFVYDFPYDPWYYFHGEEQAIALRLFTHGWDIWHIPMQPTFHLYNTKTATSVPRTLHWDKNQDQNRTSKWWQLEQRSQARLSALVAGEHLGIYGLGTERTVSDYAQFSGIDYEKRVVLPDAYIARHRDVVTK